MTYNIKMDGDESSYSPIGLTLQDWYNDEDIDDVDDGTKNIIRDCYESVSKYLGEKDYKKIIAVSDINGAENEEDFKSFMDSYCLCKGEAIELNKHWMYASGFVNDDGNKYVVLATEGAYIYCFTEEFYNTYSHE